MRVSGILMTVAALFLSSAALSDNPWTVYVQKEKGGEWRKAAYPRVSDQQADASTSRMCTSFPPVYASKAVKPATGEEIVRICADKATTVVPRGAAVGSTLVPAPHATAQSGGAAPMSYYLVMLNALRDRPGLFSDEIWNKLTAHQIRVAQSHHFSRAPLPHGADPVFTATQVKDRNPDMASAELAPVLKANLAARAKAAPAVLVAKHALLGLSYDDKTGKLVANCCYGRPRARPGLFDLLMPDLRLVNGVPSNTAAAYQPSAGLPQKAGNLATYKVKENLAANESGPVPALAAIILGGAHFGFRPEEMDIALDRWVEIDGIPMARRAAEILLNGVAGQKGSVTAHVTFAPTGAESGQFRAALYGKLISVSIVGPDGATIGKFPAEAFPKAEARPQAPASAKSASSAPPAPASAPLDVVGLRLGMSPATADKAVRAHMAVGWIYGRERAETAAATPYQAMKAYVAADLSEVVLIYFEPLTTTGTVVAMRRHSMIGQSIDAGALEAALLQKYGKPAVAKNGNWVWGRPGGCSASGTGILSLRNLKLIEGAARTDKAFQQVIASALDLATYDAVKPERYASCGPVLHVLKGKKGVMTTLVDQKSAMGHLTAKSGGAPIKLKF